MPGKYSSSLAPSQEYEENTPQKVGGEEYRERDYQISMLCLGTLPRLYLTTQFGLRYVTGRYVTASEPMDSRDEVDLWNEYFAVAPQR